MTSVEEMQGKPRPTPGILKTIETVMSVVRQSREETGFAPQSSQEPVQMTELMDLFKADLSGSGPRAPKVTVNRSCEEQEAEDLARIRAALYSA